MEFFSDRVSKYHGPRTALSQANQGPPATHWTCLMTLQIVYDSVPEQPTEQPMPMEQPNGRPHPEFKFQGPHATIGLTKIFISSDPTHRT